jgi:glucuronate isomerase
MLSKDRYFDPNPDQKALAIRLYELVRSLPIVSPHGHVDPAIFSQADYHFPNPAAILLQSNHYILRMLYAHGIDYDTILSKEQPQKAWQEFAENFHLFQGTPSGLWIAHELELVFGITDKVNRENAVRIYDQIESRLSSDEFTPRNLFKEFKIEILATTDSAIDTLAHHQAIRESGWDGKIIPTFRADDLFQINDDGWREKVKKISQKTGVEICRFPDFIMAVEQRREDFKRLGATAIDVSVPMPSTTRLSSFEINRIFDSALKGQATSKDKALFTAHMLYELARMSCDDGLVMQIHSGIYRDHNPQVYYLFGKDMGFDIPIGVEFTRNLQVLLRDFGNHPNLHLILFTLDESTYSRELAPLAGAYPSIKIGPPWWFLDSWNGMKRYFDAVMETAGIYNTAGFNDDTRAFLSIPARHDVWRRASANWLAGLLVRGLLDESDAEVLIFDLATGLAKAAYQFSS